MKKVFIDGSSGTTGLRIVSRLSGRDDIALIRLPEEQRRDIAARRDAMNQADVVFLCLPDDAAREATELVENPETAIIDTSTAHRTAPGWVYGMQELPGQREAIRQSRRIANPGCHASGFIALAAPLVAAGAIAADTPLSCFSLTGYSGGGKKMIAEYEAPERDPLWEAPRAYGLGQQHKHLPEMQRYSGLAVAPVFTPIVAPYYAGMEVMIPLHQGQLSCPAVRLGDIYRAAYADGGLIRYAADDAESGFLSAAARAGLDDMVITCTGNAERILLVARFDNLGKGASGAAIQNMNLVLGFDEKRGLEA